MKSVWFRINYCCCQYTFVFGALIREEMMKQRFVAKQDHAILSIHWSGIFDLVVYTLKYDQLAKRMDDRKELSSSV